jgi:hypothetical protein
MTQLRYRRFTRGMMGVIQSHCYSERSNYLKNGNIYQVSKEVKLSLSMA